MLDHLSLSALFKAISEPIRLRLLHLLCAEELSVSELVRILEQPQSTISRHLKALREQGLLMDRPEGASTFYRASLEQESSATETEVRDRLLDLMRAQTLPPADLLGLKRVLAARAEAEALEAAQGNAASVFFNRVGLRWDALREECFGPAFHLEAFVRLLPSEWHVADLGTGTGYLLPSLAGHFRRVSGIDNSQAMLALAEQRVREHAPDAAAAGRVQLLHGDLTELPLPDDDVDLALAVLMLHHLPDIEAALAEVRRVLHPGRGQLLVVEIYPHENERFRVQMADRRPGLAPQVLEAALRANGFTIESTATGSPAAAAWPISTPPRPEHELAPLPKLYGMLAQRGSLLGD